MLYRECPYCGANLDPGELCDCRDKEEEYKRKCADLFTHEQSGQMVLREAIA